MDNETPKQPVLTSHELVRTGPNRGKQTFRVDTRPAEPRPAEPRTYSNGYDRLAAGGQGRGGDRKPQAPRPPKVNKPVGFDHDALLQSYKGAELGITYMDGTDDRVKLIDSDRYTLMIESEEGRGLIFKSSISSILFQAKVAVN